MTEYMPWLFRWFVVACTVGGLVCVWAAVVWLAGFALNRTLQVAACVEAAVEAKRQGRAPILQAWLRFASLLGSRDE